MTRLPLLLLLSACSGQSIDISGPLGTPIQGATHGNVMYIPVAVDNTMARPLAVDTGAPVTLLDPTAFTELNLPSGQSSHTFVSGALTFKGVPAVALSPCGMMMCSDQQLDGLFGGNILRQIETTFNYRDQQLVLGPLTVPGGVEPVGASKKFDLQGGGRGQLQGASGIIDFPATRISITVTIEGTDYPFILDSGASLMVLDPAVFASLSNDGRATTQVGALTTMGMGSSQAMRLKSVVVAGAEVQGAPVLSSPLDLSQLAAEVGHPVQGLLGGTYLREFLVSADYPSTQLTLRRYDTRDHIHDEFIRVGILLAQGSDGSFAVAYVFPKTDASNNTSLTCPQGNQRLGATVVSVDGTALGGLAPEDADLTLRGTAGVYKTLVLQPPCPGFAPVTASIRVDDVLPL
jgi:hypothetical protein